MASKKQVNIKQDSNLLENEKAITKKELEWSKLFAGSIALIMGLYGMWCGIEYYRLCKIAIETNSCMPDSALAVVCVSMVLASLLSYCLYQFGLKNSRNKYGIDADGQPFKCPTGYQEDEITVCNSKQINKGK